jgi:hypothetical protein
VGSALLALGLGYLPVMATWAVAYGVGAGVILGPGSLAAPFNAPAQRRGPAAPAGAGGRAEPAPWSGRWHQW